MAKNLEQNNIEAQLKLYSEIADKYYDILYGVQIKAKELDDLILRNRTYDKSVPVSDRTESFTNEVVEKMRDITIMLSNESQFDKLCSLTIGAMSKIRENKELLQILRK